MPLTLTVIHEGESQDYVVDGLVTLGRSGDNNVVLEAAAVSRHHASLRVDGPRYEFMDLGSANGSRVRGAELDPRVPVSVVQGDEINVGPFTLVVGGAEQATMVHQMPSREVGGATVVAGSETASRSETRRDRAAERRLQAATVPALLRSSTPRASSLNAMLS